MLAVDKTEQERALLMSRADPRTYHAPLSDGLATTFITEIDQITVPKTILFEDFLCTKPLRRLELKNWMVNEELLREFSQRCFAAMTLVLDNSPNLTISMLRLIRGHKHLRKLSLQKLNCVVDREFVEVVCSLRLLMHLNISHNRIQNGSDFNIVSTTCSNLRVLYMAECKGVDDFAVSAIGQCVERFRTLERIDLSGCLDFTDEGMLALLTAGRTILRDLNVSGCTQLTNLSLSGLRGKSSLRRLTATHLATSLTLFDYLGETAKPLVYLDLSGNPGVNDQALACIGKSCKLLEGLKLSDCSGISDAGVMMFFATFHPIFVTTPADEAAATTAAVVALRPWRAAGMTKKRSLVSSRSLHQVQTAQLSKTAPLPGSSAGGKEKASVEPTSEAVTIYPPCLLTQLDLSVCVHIGSQALSFVARYCGRLKELHLDGLARASPQSLEELIPHCPDLRTWTMRAVLGGVQMHRFSTMPHVTDGILAQCVCDHLEVVDLSGAVQVSDEGVLSLAKRCRRLRVVDFANLPMLTDLGLLSLSRLCAEIESLNFSGCIHVKDDGLLAVCKGTFALALKTLHCNGCRGITDRGAEELVRCVGLQTLSLKSVDMLTDRSLVKVASTLHGLEHVDIMGCDLVSIATVHAFAVHNPRLRALNANKCNISEYEFNRAGCVIHVPPDPKLQAHPQQSKRTQKTPKGLAMLIQRQSAPPPKALLVDPHPIVHHVCEALSPDERSWGCVKTITPPQKLLPLAQPHKLHLVARHPSIQSYNLRIYTHTLPKLYQLGVLARFCAYVKLSRWKRLVAQSRSIKQRVLHAHLHAWRDFIVSNKRRRRVERVLQAVFLIQSFFRKAYVSGQARSKLAKLRRQRRGVLLLQRVYRGHMARKRYRRLYRIYSTAVNTLGRMMYLYFVMTHARKLRLRYVVHLHAWARMVPARQAYLRARTGVIALQWAVRRRIRNRMLARRRAEEAHQRAVREAARRDRAARCMQRNLKAALFNFQMSKFIFVCCIYARSKWDDEEYYSTVIQRYTRGWLVRHRIRTRAALAARRLHAAVRLQSVYRMHRVRRRYIVARDRRRRIAQRTNYFFVQLRPKLRLAQVAKRLQRAARRFLFKCRRFHAAVHIQRLYRGHRGRRRWRDLVARLRSWYADKIQRAAHRFVCRRRRLAQWRREHMAAYRIFLAVDKIFEVQRRMRRKELEEAQTRRELVDVKRETVRRRREFFVEKIRTAYVNSQALRIQRAYRQHCARRRQELGLLSRSSSSLTLGDASMTSRSQKKQSKLLQRLQLPGRVLGGGLQKLKSLFQPVNLIGEGEEKKFVNAVMSYQVKSILQEGVEDLCLTVGELETTAMTQQQRQLKNAHLAYYSQLPEDLTGALQMEVFLWVLYGEGLGCMCELALHPKPRNTSNAAMKVREQRLRDEDVKLIWHPRLHFEFHAERSVRKGKPAFAIQNLQVTCTQEDADRLALPESHMALVADMGTVGIPGVCVWSTLRKPGDADGLYRFQRLSAYDWCDERLQRTIRSFSLSEADVFALRRVFEDILAGRNRSSVRVEDIFAFVRLPLNEVGRWAVQAVEPANRREVSFSEYCHFVCYFVMLSARDLARFLFQHADNEGHHRLRRDQFQALVQMLAEGGPFNVRIWELQYDTYHDKKLKYQFVKNWCEFVTQNQGVLWQPQKLQQQLIATNLGKVYWANKMEQYRVIRENLGIRLL